MESSSLLNSGLGYGRTIHAREYALGTLEFRLVDVVYSAESYINLDTVRWSILKQGDIKVNAH
ncbi:MAG: hypothetical protein R2813_04925 [Flavobacteriales bacterium]